MEWLQSVEAHSDNIVGIVEESQMHHRELLAVVPYADQVPRPVVSHSGSEDTLGLVLLVYAIDWDAHLETLVVPLVWMIVIHICKCKKSKIVAITRPTIIVVRHQLGYQPHLLRICGGQRRLHGEGSLPQDRWAMRQRGVRQNLLGGQRWCAGYGRSRQPDDYAQTEAGEESQEDHDKLALVHRVESHMDGSLAAIVMIGGRDVPAEVAEQIAELWEGRFEAQQEPAGRQLVGVAQARGIRIRVGLGHGRWQELRVSSWCSVST